MAPCHAPFLARRCQSHRVRRRTERCVRLVQALTRLQGVLNSQYSFKRGAIACQLRAALSSLVFDKTLMVSTADMAGFSGGTVHTLMSVDADRVVNMFSWMHELWSLPLQIVVALGLLYTQACSLHWVHAIPTPEDTHLILMRDMLAAYQAVASLPPVPWLSTLAF